MALVAFKAALQLCVAKNTTRGGSVPPNTPARDTPENENVYAPLTEGAANDRTSWAAEALTFAADQVFAVSPALVITSG